MVRAAANPRRFGLWCWYLLLLAPAVGIFSVTHAWDTSPLAVFGMSALALLVLAVAGGRWFAPLTLPLAFFGVSAMAADFVRHVDLLELLLLTGGGTATEIRNSLAPYAWYAALAALVLGMWAAWLAAADDARLAPRWLAIPLAAVFVACAFVRPGAAFRAWPVNLAAGSYALVAQRDDILGMLLPYSFVDPRDRSIRWSARRESAPAAGTRETYVLVIGEAVRADRLRACGGATAIAPASDVVLACDMMAGSSSTHSSVPLLISRTKPGTSARVPHDTTFMHAFQEVGFRTSWLSVQERAIAWPDAQDERYVAGYGTDRQWLLPLLDETLARPYGKQLIVLHTYNAHYRYCSRYAHGTGPATPIDCRNGDAVPTAATRAQWLESYDGAVQETMRFIDETIARLDRAGGEAFLVYVPDHGENLADDERGLFLHALARPTRWDTRVPFIAWANTAWRTNHPAQWSHLLAIRNARLMHGDVVPTLLGAAGIAYDEPRPNVVDLTRGTPPAERLRPVLRGVGEVVDGDAL